MQTERLHSVSMRFPWKISAAVLVLALACKDDPKAACGEGMGLTLDGRAMGEVSPDSQRSVRVQPGDHALRVRTRDGQVVLAQTVRVRPNGQVRVVVTPNLGQITVRNATGRDGRLLVNGQDRGSLLSGQERVLRLEPGTISVQIRQPDRVLDSLRSNLRAGERKSWVALAPTTAELRVRNPLPVTVKVRVADREPIRIQPGEVRVLRNQPAGPSQVVVTGPDGLVLSRDQVRIDPFDGGSFMVPMPTQGAVRLVNLGAGTVDVYADGRRIASISAFDNALLQVPLGLAELTLRDRERNLMLRTAVDVQAFEAVTLRCDLQQRFLTQERKLVAEVDAFIEALRRLAS